MGTPRLLGLLERQMDLVEEEMDKGTRVDSKVLNDLVRDLDDPPTDFTFNVRQVSAALGAGHGAIVPYHG